MWSQVAPTRPRRGAALTRRRSRSPPACGQTPPCMPPRRHAPANAGGYQIALITTDLHSTPAQIVERYANRWPIEVGHDDPQPHQAPPPADSHSQSLKRPRSTHWPNPTAPDGRRPDRPRRASEPQTLYAKAPRDAAPLGGRSGQLLCCARAATRVSFSSSVWSIAPFSSAVASDIASGRRSAG